MRSDWFFLVLKAYHFWQKTRYSLQTKPTRKPCCDRETGRCRCKIRHVSKWNAASRGPPCDSTLLLLFLS